MKLRDKKRLDFVRPADSVEQLLARADSLCDFSFPIHGSVLSLRGDSSAAIKKLKREWARRKGIKIGKGEPFPISVRGDGFLADACGHLWFDEDINLAYLIGTRDSFRRLRRGILKFSQPDLSGTYLRTSELQKGFGAIARSGMALKVFDYVAHSYRGNGNDEDISTKRIWHGPKSVEIADMFGELKETGHWLSSVGIRTASDIGESTGRIGRDLNFHCEQKFLLFFKQVIRGISNQIAESRNLFKERSAKESPTKTPRPLRIVYKRDIFSDKRQNSRLLRVLGKHKDASLSVYHPNPYIHASMIDYNDGSTYTIWVTTGHEITIAPEVNATPGSFARLCNHICEHFEEGELAESKYGLGNNNQGS